MINVAIPCKNEAKSIRKVVKEWQETLPEAIVTVYNNASTDSTAEEASAAGAKVKYVATPGKGACVQQIVKDNEADVLILVDGDGQMDPSSVIHMMELMSRDDSDIVVGIRTKSVYEKPNPVRIIGNKVVNIWINILFHTKYKDILSGYRILSKHASKVLSDKLSCNGFDTEVEMSVVAHQCGLKIVEVPANFRVREPGTESKIDGVKDGFKMLWRGVLLWKRKKSI